MADVALANFLAVIRYDAEANKTLVASTENGFAELGLEAAADRGLPASLSLHVPADWAPPDDHPGVRVNDLFPGDARDTLGAALEAWRKDKGANSLGRYIRDILRRQKLDPVVHGKVAYHTQLTGTPNLLEVKDEPVYPDNGDYPDDFKDVAETGDGAARITMGAALAIAYYSFKKDTWVLNGVQLADWQIAMVMRTWVWMITNGLIPVAAAKNAADADLATMIGTWKAEHGAGSEESRSFVEVMGTPLPVDFKPSAFYGMALVNVWKTAHSSPATTFVQRDRSFAVSSLRAMGWDVPGREAAQAVWRARGGREIRANGELQCRMMADACWLVCKTLDVTTAVPSISGYAPMYPVGYLDPYETGRCLKLKPGASIRMRLRDAGQGAARLGTVRKYWANLSTSRQAMSLLATSTGTPDQLFNDIAALNALMGSAPHYAHQAWDFWRRSCNLVVPGDWGAPSGYLDQLLGLPFAHTGVSVFMQNEASWANVIALAHAYAIMLNPSLVDSEQHEAAARRATDPLIQQVAAVTISMARARTLPDELRERLGAVFALEAPEARLATVVDADKLTGAALDLTPYSGGAAVPAAVTV